MSQVKFSSIKRGDCFTHNGEKYKRLRCCVAVKVQDTNKGSSGGEVYFRVRDLVTPDDRN